MKHTHALSEKMMNLNEFLEQQESPDQCLRQLICQASELMDVQKCSVMLFRDGPDDGGQGLRIFASHGILPTQAYQEKARLHEGVAGHVAATGKPLLVNNILSSPFSGMARRPEDPNRGFVSVPVMIGGKVVGVMNLSDATDQRIFDTVDLNMATFVALMVGKSLHVIQLQNLLKSRFAQIAIARETKNIARKAISGDDFDPGKVALILARSFYREMVRSGFSSDHIITAASEIIAQLTAELRSHKENVSKGR
jgi:signal transduction protein with GAF and PtsI domain